MSDTTRAIIPWTLGRFVRLLVIALLAWAVVATGAMTIGSGGVGWPDDPFIVAARGERVMLASVVGAALACAGVAFQAVLRNPLADPYLLGVASGASLAAYLWRLPVIAAAVTSLHPALLGAGQQGFAFVGAIASAGVVLGLASLRGRLEPAALVLIGVIVSTICGALLLLVHTLVKSMPGSGYFQTLMVGELQTNLAGWQLGLAIGLTLVGMLMTTMLAAKLNLIRLSDDEAASLGVRVTRLRLTAVVVASLMTAAAVAVSGPVGFVGLIGPHLARLLVGVDHRRLVIVATALGAMLLVFADAAARYLAGTSGVNTILPIGVITSLLGGPFFLVLLLRSRRTA